VEVAEEMAAQLNLFKNVTLFHELLAGKFLNKAALKFLREAVTRLR